MPGQILKPTPENLSLASEALLRGEVVAIPTETVYGLAGVALNPLALARIFGTKERPSFDPLIVHVGMGLKRVVELERHQLIDAKKFSLEARVIADRLMGEFWPGPLTLVLPKHESVPDLATSGLPTVALRMPKHSVPQALIAATGMPLAAPSANRFGRISPTSAQDVFDELGDRVDYILDGGRCEVGVESSVISISEDGSVTLLRPGGLALEQIEKSLGKPVLRSSEKTIQGPGMLESHYAPRKPLLLLPSSLRELKALPEGWKLSGKIALLSIQGSEEEASDQWRALTGSTPLGKSLSHSGDMNEAARNLFATLRFLDQSEASVIVAEPCFVESGLGFAIGDRLRRAAAPRARS
jgi:L-threonylcarbamoyladenylate synthase